jgi:hypothetical protein
MTKHSTETYAAELDGFIGKLKNSSGGDVKSMLIEHLETANAYVRGDMPDECSVNLDMARESASDLSEAPLRQEAIEMIDRLKQRVCRWR